jgi:hypothetical protein
MSRPLNPRQERFAQLVATGMPGGRAYEEAGYAVKSPDVAESAAARLLTDVRVSAYVNEVRAAAKAKGEEAAYLTLEEKRKFLRDVVTTPIGEVDERNRLAQALKVTRGGREIKLPDKLRALELDAKLAGELKEKVEHSASPELAEWLAIRRGGQA